ncbi:MAG: amino acid adenylation domain-containing protein, partial [Acidobacteriota bacterium]
EDAFTLDRIDLGVLADEAVPDAVRRLSEEDRRRPFDLRTGPLFRATLATSGDAQYLLLCIHHIIADAWSLGVLAKELQTLCFEGLESALPELPIQYGDYAAWQHGWFRGERLERELGYWRERLADPSVLQLATDRPRPPRQTFRGSQVPVRLSKDLVERLEAQARRDNATLFHLLLSAYGALLGRYTRQDDILVGVPVSARSHVSLEPLIGFFVNTLPLRLDLSGEPDFRTLVGRVKRVTLEAYDHQDLPLEKIVEAVQPRHDPSRSPLFQTLFVLQTATRNAGRSRSLGAEEDTAKFDLSLSLRDGDDGLVGFLRYNSDLFDASTAERMVRHFCFLLETASAEPERPMHRLPLLSEAERRQIVVDWNDTALEIPLDRAVHHYVEAQAASTPDRLAYVFGDRRLTYAEANGKANALAKDLMTRGVGRGRFVPVVLDRGLEVPVSLLAVVKTGAAVVPMDYRWPPERVLSLIEALGAEWVIAQPGSPVAEQLRGRTVAVDLGALDVDAVDPQVEIDPDDPIFVLFTSGSTGTPKAAVSLHKGILNRLLWMTRQYRSTRDDVILQTTYHCFDSSFWQLLWPQMQGAMTVMPEETVGLDPAYGIDLVARWEVTITDFVPAEFDTVLQVLLRDPDGADKIRTLRQLIIGGEAINPKTVYEFRHHFPWVEIINSYGPTETSIAVVGYPLPKEPASSLPIGRPQENVVTFVVDRHLRAVPVGVPGELLLGGMCVGGGYVKDPERTAAAFIDSPFPDVCPGPVYRTGDLVRYRADGNIEFLGRIDHQIKIRGYRIEPGEIESRLRAHADVREALVMVREDRPGWPQLVAYVTGPGADAGEALRAFVGAALPAYMVPTAVVVLDRLPM